VTDQIIRIGEFDLLFRCRRPARGFLTTLSELWADDQGQEIAEHALILATILVVVIGTIRLFGSDRSDVFSTVASSLQ
jgi:Flp pilus assembly pilin Flp